MASFEEIDEYLKDVLNVKTEAEFEHRILNDKEFAEQVAFYLNFTRVARETNNETKKNRFKEIYYQGVSSKPEASIRKLWPYAAMMAAVVAALFVGIYLYMPATTATKLADTYIHDNFKKLETEMGGAQDSFDKGRILFNDSNNYKGALEKFDEVIKTDTANTDAIEYAGISALKLQQYDKAIEYFQLLATKTYLTQNPGKFYEALTLMKRNNKEDKTSYTRLLNEVKNNHLAGEDAATKFLDSF